MLFRLGKEQSVRHLIYSFKTVWLFLLVVPSALPFVTRAQSSGPGGESTLNWFTFDYNDISYNNKRMHAHSLYGTSYDWTPPKGHDIEYIAKKEGGHYLIIVLDDGSIYTFSSGFQGTFQPPNLISSGGFSFTKIEGDALFGITSSGGTFVSRDTAASWQIDTTGLGTGFPYDIGLDTLRYVYLSSSTGLYRQHPDTSIWRKVTSFPVAFTNAVFVDRKNRIFVASSRKTYVSTNSGATWNIDTTGLTVKDILGLKGFCDDAYGNIYARSATELWRSTGGTQPWTHIDQPLNALAFDPSVYPLFNNLSGDSLLYASTVFGSYVSSDQGTSWTRDSSQFSASFIYGFAKTSAGRCLTSTNLGVYYRNPGDLQWTKTFPTSGYLAASPVFLDGSSNAYTLGKKVSSASLSDVRSNWKSTDGGLTWNADTAGLGSSGTGQTPLYFVDELGTQYYGAYGSPANFYRKTSGQNWTPDTGGYGSRPSEYPIAFGTDHHGFVYVATNSLSTYKGMVWKRSITGGTWTADTSGLAGTQIYSITADKSGNTIAGAIDGVYKKSGGVWSKVPSPSLLNGYSAFVVSVDSAGNTLAGFSVFGIPNYTWRGVYATKNNGSTWTYLGLDSISVRGLVSYGDSTFAFTYADGLYLVRSTAGASSVGTKTQPTTYSLEQNYPNPFNPTTTIQFSISKSSIVKLKIFDILGREVTTLVNGELEAGQHQAIFDASKFASGIYLYRVWAGDFTSTKKLVLIK